MGRPEEATPAGTDGDPSRPPSGVAPVVVVGGGVIGCAVAHALARRGVPATLLEAEAALALGASGANSGILHTGFDSRPGELETRLILRAAELREELAGELDVPIWRCGARMTPARADEREAVAALHANARANGVPAVLGDDGSLVIPGEAVTDPVRFVDALAAAAAAGGAQIRVGARVCSLARDASSGAIEVGIEPGAPSPGAPLRLLARTVVNCAGLFADEVAALGGDPDLAVYPRKGEFLVFAPAPAAPLREILLPVPSQMGKGVLVFPALGGHVVAGPTAREREDKYDWSVEPDAAELILARAVGMLPELRGREPLEAYAGLRPAGRGCNYVIRRSDAMRGLVHVAAIRSTGLSAALAVGEYVAGMLGDEGAVRLLAARALRPAAGSRAGTADDADGRWWARGARLRAGAGRA